MTLVRYLISKAVVLDVVSYIRSKNSILEFWKFQKTINFLIILKGTIIQAG